MRSGMRRWFLSYTSQDFALTQALKEALQRLDRDAQIFFAPESMRAGGFWQQQLAEEIVASTAFVLLVGENGVGPWQVMEYCEALDRRAKEANYPIILILSAKRAAPGLPFVRQLHWVVTEDPASEATVGKLIDAASRPASQPAELWRHTRPYRGLEAMTEANCDFFFGRGRETVEVIDVLARERGKIPILLGNSGVGKSSLARAGVFASLLRQGWPEHVKDAPPWPAAFDRSRHGCFLNVRPGTEPLKALVAPFLDTWQYGSTSPKRAAEQNDWIEVLRDGKATLADLLDATEKRYAELQQPAPEAFFLYIDQGEELYVRAERQQRRRFSEIVAAALAGTRLRALMSLRADFFGELQKDEALYGVHRLINVPPLREADLYRIVSEPARLLGAKFQSETLSRDIARRTAEESTEDAGALPLLSYLLDDMWTQMVERGDGVLRLPMQAVELGRVLVERANKFVAEHPGSESALRRIFTLNLATVRADGEPTRRRASRSEFSEDEWKLVSELADYPNRLLVTAAPAGTETYAEVAHEAIFRSWEKLREWIAAEREFLAWRSGLEASRRAWQATPEPFKPDALLMGLALSQAENWHGKRAVDILPADREFILQSTKAAQRRQRRVQILVGAPLLAIVVVLIGWMNESYMRADWRWFTVIRPYMTNEVRPYVLAAPAEQALKPGDSFRECAKNCPEMIVIPAGNFVMGSPPSEIGRNDNEGPQHKVVVEKLFAVSKFDVTFDEWDTCVAYGDCAQIGDSTFGRGRHPVINVTFDDARRYLAWLSSMTGKPYRLLSEAEWEYAARAGTTTRFSFGDDDSQAGKYAWYSQNSDSKSHEVGLKLPNPFQLYDMQGDVWEWVEDCYGPYTDQPTTSASVIRGDCSRRVVRGGSWYYNATYLRSAERDKISIDNRFNSLGFRVARTLAP